MSQSKLFYISLLSAFGITYFAVGMLLDVADIARTAGSYAMAIAILISVGPLALSWGGAAILYLSTLPKLSNWASKGYKFFVFLLVTVLPWAVLFFGSIYVAILRFQ